MTASTAQFDSVRKEVVAACLKLADRGFLAGIGGNIALRADDAHFAVTPSAADYYALSPQDICVLRLDDLTRVAGEMQPSVESGMHAALLRRRPDLNASVHTHQPIASAIALLNRELPVVDPTARAALGPVVALTGYAPSGTSWLVKAFQKVLRDDVNAYLLRNHGVICGAQDLERAARNVEHIEAEAARYIEAGIQRNLQTNAGRRMRENAAEVLEQSLRAVQSHQTI